MAIAAHMEESSGSSQNPREPRRSIRLETTGTLPTGSSDMVMVHNISRAGLLIETARRIPVGERFSIDLPGADGTVAHVVWTSQRLHGCRFEKPVPQSVLAAAQLRSAVSTQDTAETGVGGLQGGEPFGGRLQRLRKARGLSLSQVADILGVSKPTVWAWEHGRARPVADRIDALAAALETTPQELLTGADSSELADLLSGSRDRIAQVYGVAPEAIRIMIEL